MQNCIEFWQDERKNGSFFFIVNKIMFTKRKIWKILKRAPNNRNEKTRQCANILCRLILLWSQSHVKIVFHLLNIFQWKCEQHSELSCDRVCVSAIEYFFYCQCLSLLFCTFALQYFKSIFLFENSRCIAPLHHCRHHAVTSFAFVYVCANFVVACMWASFCLYYLKKNVK